MHPVGLHAATPPGVLAGTFCTANASFLSRWWLSKATASLTSLEGTRAALPFSSFLFPFPLPSS